MLLLLLRPFLDHQKFPTSCRQSIPVILHEPTLISAEGVGLLLLLGCFKFWVWKRFSFTVKMFRFDFIYLEPEGIEKERSERLSLTNSLGYEAVHFHLEIWTEQLFIEILVHFMI